MNRGWDRRDGGNSAPSGPSYWNTSRVAFLVGDSGSFSSDERLRVEVTSRRQGTGGSFDDVEGRVNKLGKRWREFENTSPFCPQRTEMGWDFGP